MKQEPTVLDYFKALLTPWRGAPPPLPWAGEARPEPESNTLQAPIPSVDEPQPENSASQPAASETVLDAVPEAIPAAGIVAPPAPATQQAEAAAPKELTPQPPTGDRIPQGDVPKPIREPDPEPEPLLAKPGWPWRALLALLLALVAQRSLEPGPDRGWTLGLILYLAAAALVVWAYLRGEWPLAPLPAREKSSDPLTVRSIALWIGAPLAALAFLAFGGNQFTSLNLILWLSALILIIYAFWLPISEPRTIRYRITDYGSRVSHYALRITPFLLAIIAVALVAIFYRTYHINSVPPEMVSDHAEKLLDVWDVLHGQHRIFFPRNTGREPLQMYLTAAIARTLNFGISFLSLKTGTILAGLLTLPFLYLLGVEIANRRVGLLAALFAGIAYWPNVISRMGLRFPFYPLFVAPALYFLIRGLRRGTRNDFLLSGLALGIGLHGYTPIRILPLVIVAAVGIYLLHRQSHGLRRQAVFGLLLVALISFVVFLPLARYWLDNPGMFAFRAFSRVGTVEQPLPGPAWQIFLSNLGHALVMFSWDNGEIWPISIPHRPALDVVSGALFHLGVVMLLVRYLRRRHWLDLFLLLAIPLLMLPSILSLAFPSENPALNRAGGALVPVFLIIGLAADGLFSGLQRALATTGQIGRGRALAWGVLGLLLLWSGVQNYDLVFNRYYRQYAASAWNTSEMGAVMRDFTGIGGSLDNAWVVGYPYWVDTRLVGIQAGAPTRDMVLFPEDLEKTQDVPGPKLFLLKPEDEAAARTLRNLYPNGWLRTYDSAVENKDFLMFFVPPEF